jgi:amicyanin
MRRLPTAPWRAAAGAAALTFAVIGLAACGNKPASSASGSAYAAPAGSRATTTTTPDMTSMTNMPSTSAAPSGPAVATDQVSITNFTFSPPAITVKMGTTVTWTNNDEEPHTVFSSTGGMKSQVLASHQSTYTFTFTKAGTFDYNCTIHPFMHGTVTVTA